MLGNSRHLILLYTSRPLLLGVGIMASAARPPESQSLPPEYTAVILSQALLQQLRSSSAILDYSLYQSTNASLGPLIGGTVPLFDDQNAAITTILPTAAHLHVATPDQHQHCLQLNASQLGELSTSVTSWIWPSVVEMSQSRWKISQSAALRHSVRPPPGRRSGGSGKRQRRSTVKLE